MNCIKKIIWIICLVSLIPIFPNFGRADDFNVTPSLTVREEYNDNIFIEYSDAIDDYITTVAAGLELTERTEQLDLSLKGIVSPYFYADNSEGDDVDQNYTGKVDYKVNPVLGIKANAGYDVSNRPDRDVYTTGLVLSNRRRKTQAYGAAVDYTLTEFSAVGVFFKYSEDKWDEGNIANENQKDYSTGLNVTHNLNQWWDGTLGSLNLGFDRFEYETSDTSNYVVTIGVQHQFSQTINLMIAGGLQYADADFLTPQLVEDNNKSFGGTGQALLTVKGELTTGRVSVHHGISPANGRGTTVQRTEAVFDVRRRFAEKLSVGMAAGYYHNRADKDEFSAIKIDEDAYYLRPSIQWEIFDRFKLEAGYNFIYIDDHAVSNDRKQNMVYLQAGYEIPLFE